MLHKPPLPYMLSSIIIELTTVKITTVDFSELNEKLLCLLY